VCVVTPTKLQDIFVNHPSSFFFNEKYSPSGNNLLTLEWTDISVQRNKWTSAYRDSAGPVGLGVPLSEASVESIPSPWRLVPLGSRRPVVGRRSPFSRCFYQRWPTGVSQLNEDIPLIPSESEVHLLTVTLKASMSNSLQSGRLHIWKLAAQRTQPDMPSLNVMADAILQ